jgi:hypothetical protein
MKQTNQMKQKFIMFSLFTVFTAVIALTGCSKNDSVIGPNGSSQVSFQISQQSGQFGGVQFLFKPSVDTKISRIISKFSAQQFADTISFGNQNYVYSKDTVYIVSEYTGIQNGQQWNFDFTGSIPNQNNSNYTVTANYTAQ